jgi:hypothetical protein
MTNVNLDEIHLADDPLNGLEQTKNISSNILKYLNWINILKPSDLLNPVDHLKIMKDKYIDPFIEKINYSFIYTICTALNIYGKRLLKIETDLIEKIDIKNSEAIIYLYPINFNNMEHIYEKNKIIIDNMTIDNIILKIAINNNKINHARVEINEINISIDFSKHDDSVYYSIIDSVNSFLKNNTNDATDSHKNDDIIFIVREFKKIISQYFEKIDININLIKINLKNDIVVTIRNFFSINYVVSNKSEIIITIDDVSITSSFEPSHIADVFCQKLQFNYVHNLFNCNSVSGSSNEEPNIVCGSLFQINEVTINNTFPTLLAKLPKIEESDKEINLNINLKINLCNILLPKNSQNIKIINIDLEMLNKTISVMDTLEISSYFFFKITDVDDDNKYFLTFNFPEKNKNFIDFKRMFDHH